MGGRGWKRRGNPSLLSVYLEITLQITRDTFSKKCWGNIERNRTCYLEINLGKTVLSIIWKKYFEKLKDEIEAPFYIEITREYILLNAISNSLFDAITFFSSLFFFLHGYPMFSARFAFKSPVYRRCSGAKKPLIPYSACEYKLFDKKHCRNIETIYRIVPFYYN